MIVLEYISEEEFNKHNPIFRVIEHPGARKYALVEPPGISQPFVLSWFSELIEPVIVANTFSGATWLGVDQRVCCISSQGSIVASLGLPSVLLHIKCFEFYTVVLCDIIALVFNQNYSLQGSYNLPELPFDAEINQDKLIVTCENGYIQVLNKVV